MMWNISKALQSTFLLSFIVTCVAESDGSDGRETDDAIQSEDLNNARTFLNHNRWIAVDFKKPGGRRYLYIVYDDPDLGQLGDVRPNKHKFDSKLDHVGVFDYMSAILSERLDNKDEPSKELDIQQKNELRSRFCRMVGRPNDRWEVNQLSAEEAAIKLWSSIYDFDFRPERIVDQEKVHSLLDVAPWPGLLFYKNTAPVGALLSMCSSKLAKCDIILDLPMTGVFCKPAAEKDNRNTVWRTPLKPNRKAKAALVAILNDARSSNSLRTEEFEETSKSRTTNEKIVSAFCAYFQLDTGRLDSWKVKKLSAEEIASYFPYEIEEALDKVEQKQLHARQATSKERDSPSNSAIQQGTTKEEAAGWTTDDQTTEGLSTVQSGIESIGLANV